MQRNWWNRSHALWALSLGLIITACSNEKPVQLEAGTYLPQNIEVIYPAQDLDSETHRAAQMALSSIITEQLQKSYFTIDIPTIHLFINGETSQGVITPENLVLSQLATLQLKPEKAGTITVLSHDYHLCQQFSCDIQFTLTKTAADSAEIQTIINKTIAAETAKTNAAEELPSIDIPTLLETTFWGIEHEISDQLSLKLSPIQSNGLIYGVPEHTQMETFELGNILIDPQSPDIETLSFYSNAAPSSDVHQVDTMSYLFIIPQGKMPDLDLTTIDTENSHYYADTQNLLAKDNTGFYAIQYRYFPNIQKIMVALTESLSLDDMLLHFQAIDTVKATIDTSTTAKDSDKKIELLNDKDSKTILLTDINLPIKTLQDHYGISLTDMFRVTEIQESYRQELKRLLTSADIFLKTGPHTQNGYHLFTQYFGDYRFNETYLKIHHDTLKNVIVAVQTLNNTNDNQTSKSNNSSNTHQKMEDIKGLWKNPIYLYSTNPKEASGISYFKEIQPGVTLEIFSPAFQGHIAEKVLFSKLLEGISWKNIPKLSKTAMRNIAKYTAIQEDTSDADHENDSGESSKKPQEPKKFYEFKEGKTDLQGTLQTSKS